MTKLNKIEKATNFVLARCEEHRWVHLTQEQYEQGLERKDWPCPRPGCGRKVRPASGGAITLARC
jgi:hypothetical protein